MKKHPASLCINEDGHEVIAFYPDDLRNMISDIKEAHDRRIAELEAEVAALRATKARWVPVSERLPSDGLIRLIVVRRSNGSILDLDAYNQCEGWRYYSDDSVTHWLDNVPEVPR